MSTKKLIIALLSALVLLNLIAWVKTVISVSAQVDLDPNALPPATQNTLACGKFGVNFGTAYAVADQQYQRAAAHNLGWTLAIAHASDPNATIEGINRALDKNMTPIVRIGVGSGSLGFINPLTYLNFLNQVAGQVSGTFYAVAGPNEPEFEHWLVQEEGRDPGCQPVPGAGQQGYTLENPGSADYVMAGRCMALYMKPLLDAKKAGTLNSNIKLLSPSYSLTSWMSEELITRTEEELAKLGHSMADLDGFSGTSYSGVGGVGDIQTQLAKVTTRFPNLPIVLTEYSDGDGNGDLEGYKAIVDYARTDSRILGATFFCPFDTCSGWDGFKLAEEELNYILGSQCAANFRVLENIRPTPRASIRPCTTEDNPEFHPLRPYPGEPCDPLIPRSDPRADRIAPKTDMSWQAILAADYQMRNSVAFSCGNSLTPTRIRQFDRGSRSIPEGCVQSGNKVRCVLRESFSLTLDLKNANIPILGNTQTRGLTDAVKMTEYLSWFLNGAVTHAEQNLSPSTNRLVNFSGPLQKLLPQDLVRWIKTELRGGPAGIPFDPPSGGGQYHNYIVYDPTRLKSVWEQLFKAVPFASLEDTTGEVVISISDIEAHNQQDPDVLEAIGETGQKPELRIRRNAP